MHQRHSARDAHHRRAALIHRFKTLFRSQMLLQHVAPGTESSRSPRKPDCTAAAAPASARTGTACAPSGAARLHTTPLSTSVKPVQPSLTLTRVRSCTHNSPYPLILLDSMLLTNLDSLFVPPRPVARRLACCPAAWVSLLCRLTSTTTATALRPPSPPAHPLQKHPPRHPEADSSAEGSLLLLTLHRSPTSPLTQRYYSATILPELRRQRSTMSTRNFLPPHHPHQTQSRPRDNRHSLPTNFPVTHTKHSLAPILNRHKFAPFSQRFRVRRQAAALPSTTSRPNDSILSQPSISNRHQNPLEFHATPTKHSPPALSNRQLMHQIFHPKIRANTRHRRQAER